MHGPTLTSLLDNLTVVTEKDRSFLIEPRVELESQSTAVKGLRTRPLSDGLSLPIYVARDFMLTGLMQNQARLLSSLPYLQNTQRSARCVFSRKRAGFSDIHTDIFFSRVRLCK